jgi:hypothetical protein
MEDELGQVERGKQGLHAVAEDWRLGGSRIPDEPSGRGRREAFNIVLGMPRGTDPLTVLRAAREFARTELADHKLVLVLHDHQANPHVHLSVRAESKHGKRLNPRKADLHRWRETFADKLRDWGIDAEATREVTRGASRSHEPLWRVKAQEEGRLRRPRPAMRSGSTAGRSRASAQEAWQTIARALEGSSDVNDRALAEGIRAFVHARADRAPLAPDVSRRSSGSGNLERSSGR